MLRRVLSIGAVTSIITGLLVVPAITAYASRQTDSVVIDGKNPTFTKSYPAIPGVAVTTQSPHVRQGPFYVGNTNAGEVGVTEQTVPGSVTGDPQLSFARCSGSSTPGAARGAGAPNYAGAFPWCDTVELLINNVPKDAPYAAVIDLTWPGDELIDPATKKVKKLNNLDFYFYIDTYEGWVFEGDPFGVDGNVVEFSTAPTATKLSRTLYHPETLVVADVPASREKVQRDIPGRRTLGGATVFSNTYDLNGTGIDDVPECPAQVLAATPEMCPKIIEHYNYFTYWLLIINRTDAKTPGPEAINKGYTISSKVDVVTFPDEGGEGNAPFSFEDLNLGDDAIFDFDDFKPDVESLKPVKTPGADGPAATYNLMALKGASKGPQKQGDNGLVLGVGILLALGLGLFLLLMFMRRRRRAEA